MPPVVRYPRRASTTAMTPTWSCGRAAAAASRGTAHRPRERYFLACQYRERAPMGLGERSCGGQRRCKDLATSRWQERGEALSRERLEEGCRRTQHI